ncbi:hypothetical protein LTR56_004496 [Elasticomyces elasticus]|nr:hypothetical protein LTR56_004496 [Elasticomyces elasticus]KAK3654230.1 hypothetical protein LTR22_010856 [Elasticomyces elasticus]KAK4919997.1 hypothetical protein LTR49_012435 [Elasticomyces elasticus]KAK5758831.1 hypothetical protein LTS12_011072 [Elasticomyces elasticus]
MASTAVFDTTELLEHILSSLAFVDLVHAERVDRYWRDVVASSVRLKETLFLKAAPAEVFATVSTTANRERKRELLLSTDKSWPMMLVQPHPTLSATAKSAPGRTNDITCTIDIDLLNSPVAGRGRKCYVSQPTCKKALLMSLMQDSHPDGLWRQVYSLVEVDSGVRFDDIASSVTRARCRNTSQGTVQKKSSAATQKLVRITMWDSVQTNDPNVMEAVRAKRVREMLR